MALADIDTLSLKDLKQLEKDVAKAIASHGDRRKSEARATLEASAKELGYSLNDLTGDDKKRTRAPGVAKYRHPENEALTWSGRGRKPHWFQDAMDAGAAPDDLLIR